MVRAIPAYMAVNRTPRAVDPDPLPHFRPVIIVMAKVPRIGVVKTRLQPFLTGEQCSSLAEAFLKDTVRMATSICADVIVAFYPPDGRNEIAQIVGADITLIPQDGAGLGERLDGAVSEAAHLEFSPIVVIGTDSPTLPYEFLIDAMAAFREPDTDVVLGGTEDGGYYLIALRRPTPGIFDDIRWSSEHVYRDTLARAQTLGLTRIGELQRWYDVDNPPDLIRLRKEFATDGSLKSRCPNMHAWLGENLLPLDAS
ncbi:MAG: TIGR04282 family arsenosugar biosynthesis glycosyltransferase [Acidobacteriota bacterium]